MSIVEQIKSILGVSTTNYDYLIILVSSIVLLYLLKSILAVIYSIFK